MGMALARQSGLVVDNTLPIGGLDTMLSCLPLTELKKRVLPCDR